MGRIEPMPELPRLLIVDGPEKGGKSTFIAAIEHMIESKFGKNMILKRHWNHHTPRFSDHFSILFDDLAQLQYPFVIWDRGWFSEYVYSTLLNRETDATIELMDTYDSRWRDTLDRIGKRAIILGTSAEDLALRRDASDLPVSPDAERKLFKFLGYRYGWNVSENGALDSALIRHTRTALKLDAL